MGQLSNVGLNDKMLSYELRDPFKSVIEANKKDPEGSNFDIWLGIKNDYRTLIGLESVNIVEKTENSDEEDGNV